MNFQRTFLFFTYATAIWAFAAMAFFVQLHPPLIVTFLVVMAVVTTRGWHGLRIPPAVWHLASIMVLILGLYAWFQLYERLYAVVYAFLYLEINKLWTAEKNKDYLQVLGLTFFQVLAASVSTASVFFAPVLIIYLFLVLGALISVTIKNDAELAFRGERRAPRAWRREGEREQRRLADFATMPFLGAGLIRTLAAALVGIMVVGTGLFYVIPRLQARTFISAVSQAGRATSVSGFSESVDFVGMGEIQTDNTIAARAIPHRGYRYDGGHPVPALLRLRGTALDHYDGRRWDKSTEVRNRIVARGRSSQVSVNDFARQSGQRVETTIHLEPNSGGYLFAPGRAGEYSFDVGMVFARDTVSDSLQLGLERWSSTLSYRVTSVLPSIDVSEEEFSGRLSVEELAPEPEYLPLRLLARFTDPDARGHISNEYLSRREVERFYLQMPDHPDMETVRELGREWVADAATDFAKAKAIEVRLKSEYGYSLDVSFSRFEKHLSHFLQRTRAAHCEYFATAMVLMLRAEGVPARIVNGYATDEWVRSGSYYIVRNAHAHSWVEAYMPRHGWVTFDPTPPSGLGTNRMPNNLAVWFSRLLDGVKFAWYDRVIDYDARDQMGMYTSLFMTLDRFDAESLMRALSGRGDSAGRGRTLLIAVLVVGGFVLAVLLLREVLALRRRRRMAVELLPEDTRSSVMIEAYLALLAAADRVARRSPGETPQEYAHALAHRFGDLGDFPSLTAEYYRARYNGHQWSTEHTARARELLRLLATGAYVVGPAAGESPPPSQG